MRLSLRIIALFFAGVLVLLVADSALLVRHDMQMLDRNIRRDAVHLGNVYGEMLQHIAETAGIERAVKLVGELDQEEHDMRLRWVWLDDLPPSPHAPRDEPERLTRVAAGETLSIKRTDTGGPDLLAVYVPVDLGSGRGGALELTESLAAAEGYRRLIVRRSLVLVAAMAVLALLMSWLILVPLVGRPLREILHKTERIGAGDFSCDLDLPGRSELSDLSLAMNRMCSQLDTARTSLQAESEARVEALEQLRHSERLAMIGRIASGLAHELGTPLNVVSGRAKMIGSGDLQPDEVADSARIVREQAERMTGIIRQLLDFARRPAGKRQRQPLEPVVASVVRMLEPTARGARVQLEVESAGGEPAPVIDRNQIEQVLINLIMNAVQAQPDGGRVRIGIAPAPADGALGVQVTIADEGVGMDREQLEQIFEPFFTTKSAGQGTGLGLPIVQGIVEEHAGEIRVESEPGRGTTFTLVLPAGEEA